MFVSKSLRSLSGASINQRYGLLKFSADTCTLPPVPRRLPKVISSSLVSFYGDTSKGFHRGSPHVPVLIVELDGYRVEQSRVQLATVEQVAVAKLGKLTWLQERPDAPKKIAAQTFYGDHVDHGTSTLLEP